MKNKESDLHSVLNTFADNNIFTTISGTHAIRRALSTVYNEKKKNIHRSLPLTPIKYPNKPFYALLLTTRCRYDRCLCTYVRRGTGLPPAKSSGFLVTFTKLDRLNRCKEIVEFVPEKWVVYIRLYK